MNDDPILSAADLLAQKKNLLIFTGAGVSVESGIPPFRGPGGLWQKVNPDFFDIDHFMSHPVESWKRIRSIFYDLWGQCTPNPAHLAFAELERLGVAFSLVTQNIDNLHQLAGSKNVIEFHGTLGRLRCTQCAFTGAPTKELLAGDPPTCPDCGGLLKPDIVFFGESIPEYALNQSFADAESCSVCLVSGTTGEVMPACMVPQTAKRRGAVVIEVNPEESAFTAHTTDIFLRGKAGEIMPRLVAEVVKRLS
ncbi:MAG: NAD-dependent deacylase [Lentisphaeria bacterium]|nr:NAD-dependent deacylase [Lentisphaeria bacterium]